MRGKNKNRAANTEAHHGCVTILLFVRDKLGCVFFTSTNLHQSLPLEVLTTAAAG